MSARSIYFVLISGIAIALLSTPGYPQGPFGRLEGAVLDPSGAGIPGCRISAVRDDPKKPVEVTADKKGIFLFQALPSGEYTITVQAADFRTEVRSGVVIEPGTTAFQQFHLVPGTAGTSEATKVGPVAVDPQPAIQGRMGPEQMLALPQIERQPINLAAFQPGVQVEGGDVSHSRVDGTREATSNLRIDGLDANDPLTPRFGLPAVSLNTDSIASVRVVTSNAGAVSGPGGAARVEMITRSGGSQWSGSAFEYFRNKSLNANDFFNNATDVAQPTFSQHLFGGSLGGSVIPGKTFVFVNAQGRRTAQDVVRNRMVLTDEAKSGVFRWYRPNTATLQSYDIAKNDKRKIGIDSQVSQLLSRLPEYNNTDIGDGLNTAGYRFNDPVNSYDYQATVRLDHSLTARHRLFYRMNWYKNSSVDVLGGNEARFPGQENGTEEGHSYSHAAGSDWIVSPDWTNQARFAIRRGYLDSKRPDRQSGAMFLSNIWTDPLNPAFPSARDHKVMQINDVVASQRGRHYFRAGVEFTETTLNSSTEDGTYPNVTFTRDNGNTPPGNVGPIGTAVISTADRQRFENFYNNLLGRMDKVTQTFYSNLEEFQAAGTQRMRSYKARDYSLFVQDDWRLRSNLTLTLGLRYELEGLPSELNGLQATLDEASLIDAASQISDFEFLPTNKWYQRDDNNFAPRFGFAWDPGNSGKTVVRGGYGMFYEHLSGAVTNTIDAYTTAFAQTVTVYPNTGGKDVRATDGIPALTPKSAPVLTPPVTRSTSVAVFNPKLRTGYVHQFSLSLQRQIRNDTVLEAAYVGTRGVKLYMNLDLNQPRIEEDFLKAFREFQVYRASGTPVSSTNTLVRMFGSVDAVVAAIGASTIDQGQAGAAADTVDKTYYTKYRNAGLSSFYLRNFPQFDQLIFGTNAGRSWYDSLQVNLQHRRGDLMLNAHYIWGKSLDNTSAEGEGFSSPIDNFNLGLNKARSDFDRPHMFNLSAIYALPIGEGHRLFGRADTPWWINTLFSQWEVSALCLYEMGKPFSISSGRRTAGADTLTYADYAGNRATRAIERRTDGIYYFSADSLAEFTSPQAGSTGTSGRNAFLGPRYFNLDLSLTKRFYLTETKSVLFRAEAYNVLNHPNFGLPEANLVTPTSFGKIGTMEGAPRNLQVALRFEF